jgi:hypothetical protein
VSSAFTSQIPQGDPHKLEVEEAVRAALRDQPLPWDVEITRSCTSRARFFINLKQTRTGLRRTVFVNGLRSQGLRRIQKRIRDVLA